METTSYTITSYHTLANNNNMQSSIYDSLSRDAVTAAESLSIMLKNEQTFYERRDYLHCHHPSSLSSLPSLPTAITNECLLPIITESDRLKIVDWCYSIVDRLEFDRETVAMAVELLDRFLSKPSDGACEALHSHNRFQLVAITALYIAIKTNEEVALGCDFFSAMSNGMYSEEDIKYMELSILSGLSWRINSPTSLQICHAILSLVLQHTDLDESVWVFILDEVRYQIETSLRDYTLCTKRPSTVAMAATFNTLTQVNRQDRQMILRGLLLVTNSMDFDSTDVLIHATTRLRRCHLVTEDNNYVVEYDATIVSDTSSDAVEFVSNTESGTSYYHEDELSIQTNYAPLDDRETTFLCKDCIDDTY